MRLRTCESFWLLKNGLLHNYPSLHHEEANAQIVVVGGGITGALISHALMEKNYDVLLIDKRDIAMGSTSATTSMLQYEIDVPLYQLSEMIGEEAAVLCYKAGIEAIHTLEKLVADQEMDCGFEKKSSLYIARNGKDAKWLRTEFELREKHQMGVTWLKAGDVFKRYGIKCSGAILSDTAASADAYKLAHELIAFNAARGMKVYDQTVVEKFDFEGVRVTLSIAEKATITCDKIIFCSGFEAGEVLKEKIADLFYTYACVSETEIKIPEQLRDTLVWDTGNPYLYMRTTDDGRLLVGGEDSNSNHSLFQNRIKERKSKKLQKHLAKLMPGVEFIEDFSWGGTFGSTKDGLPYIGPSPDHRNAYFVLGYGGNGITFSVQGMEIITDLLEGKENKLAGLYRFGR